MGDEAVRIGVEQAWAVEIERRIKELDEGTVQSIPWDQLRARFTAAPSQQVKYDPRNSFPETGSKRNYSDKRQVPPDFHDSFPSVTHGYSWKAKVPNGLATPHAEPTPRI